MVDVVDISIDAGRFITGGYIAGGVVEHFQRSALRDFVEDLLTAYFKDPNQLAQIRQHVGLDHGRFGFPLPAEHKVFMMDSKKFDHLREMHNSGKLDLYAMAGLLSFDSFEMYPRPRTVIKSVDDNGNESLFPITRWTLSRYINENNGRIRVYAMSREAIAEKLSIATSKCEQLGVKLSWNNGENFSWFRHYDVHEIYTEGEYLFELFPDQQTSPPSPGLEQYLGQKQLKPGLNTIQDCTLLAFGAFRYVRFNSSSKELFGLTVGRQICEGIDVSLNCPTGQNIPIGQRTDNCCNTLVNNPICDQPGPTGGSGVIHRDVWPDYGCRYFLVHEIGHYLGLCHFGHDGIQNIMFQFGANSTLSWGLFNYYLDSEPRFTLEDAKNCWRFIVDQMAQCLLNQFTVSVTTSPDGLIHLLQLRTKSAL